MSASPKPTTRLTRLDDILSLSPAAPSRGADVDSGQAHLMSVPLDRIRALTIELQERSAFAQDDIDAITMRVLLNEYKSAVAHLRAVTNDVEVRLRAASKHLSYSGKVVRRDQELLAKRSARPATSDTE